MNDLTDAELPGYALIHCETPVAAFHRKHVVRLLRLAGMDDDAEACAKDHREFFYLGGGVIRPIVAKILPKHKEGLPHAE